MLSQQKMYLLHTFFQENSVMKNFLQNIYVIDLFAIENCLRNFVKRNYCYVFYKRLLISIYFLIEYISYRKKKFFFPFSYEYFGLLTLSYN